MNAKRKLVWAAAACALSLANLSHASYNPTGVRNDVPFDTVINGGWTVVYRGDYATSSIDISYIFDSIADGSGVMLAAIHDNSTTYDVLAWATKQDVLQWTDTSTTHSANGVNWYFNNSSMGFAGAGDEIFQITADVVGSGVFGMDPNGLERDRLSWHTSGSNYGDLVMNGGWRSGTNVWLNNSTDWDRLILVQSPIPEAESHTMMAAGLGLLVLILRRARRVA